MAKVSAFLADGCEEVECVAVVDMLRRAGITVELVSIADKDFVTSSRGVKVGADKKFREADFSDSDILFLPGGMPGTKNLYECKPLCDLLKKQNDEGKRIAAICAAPGYVLGQLGLLKGHTATVHPGFEEYLVGATYTHDGVVTSGNITTARGVGFAIDLGLELVGLLLGNDAKEELRGKIQYPGL